MADRGSNRILEFSPSGKLITEFAPAGAAALAGPEGLAVTAAGPVWVADTGRNRLVKLSAGGKVLAVAGQPGSGPGQLSGPAAVAVARSGDVFVADEGHSRVAEFSPSGGYLRAFPVATPDGVAIDRAGHVWGSSAGYAVDAVGVDGNKVREFSAAGAAIRSFGSTQSGYGALSNPAGIAVGPAGQVYVAQPDFGWVTVFGPAGQYATEFGLASGPGAGGRGLAFPQGLAVTAVGQVWVADSGNGRIAEYAPAGLAATPPVPPPAAPTGLPWLVLLPLALLSLLLLLILAARRSVSGVVLKPAPATERIPAGRSHGYLQAACARRESAGRARPGETSASMPRMTGVTRRRVLGGTALAGGALAGAAVLPLSLRQALAASMASPPGGRLTDIKHIVILMQENRSFDHYFGAMPGVRGFGDPAAMRLADGKPVFYQPDPAHPQGYLLPFRLDTASTSAQAIPSTDHFWPSQHQAWANGKMDAWIPAKGPLTMGYFTRDDIPFHWALADAFTICDRYHCSVFGPTNPNRLYMWTGMIDPAGGSGGPVIDDSPGSDNVILSWTTYPERLERAGISWQVYQEEDNFDDNALAWFTQYAKLRPSSPLYQRGMARRPGDTFEDDARGDTGSRRCPGWWHRPPSPSTRTTTPPRAPSTSRRSWTRSRRTRRCGRRRPSFSATTRTTGCSIMCRRPRRPRAREASSCRACRSASASGVAYAYRGLAVDGRHGYVNSGLFDHTSLIRLIEARFGVREPNISAWRRQTCGDLTSVFRFSCGARRVPAGQPAAPGSRPRRRGWPPPSR